MILLNIQYMYLKCVSKDTGLFHIFIDYHQIGKVSLYGLWDDFLQVQTSSVSNL